MDVGMHCAVESCRRLDFLPFTCELCQATYCKEHVAADSHNCHSLSQKAGEKWANVSSDHTPLCSVAECGRRERVEVICPHCNCRLCLAHRHPEDHSCPSFLTPSTRATSRESTAGKRDTSSSRKTSGGGRGGARSDSLSAKVMLMKLKQKADGPQSIPQSERVYYTVALPASCRVQSAPMFFSKEWAVGKVVDSVSQKFKISNHNNLSDSKKLTLLGPDGTALVPSRPLYSYLELVPSGSSVAIDYVQLPANS